jgi:hypothetical protein
MPAAARIRATEQKKALKATLSGNRRAPKDVAEFVGVAYQTLMGWADEHVDSHPSGSRIPALLTASDDTSLLEYWANLQGCAVVRQPRAGTEPVDVCQLAELAGEFSALLAHHAAAHADGRWTLDEVEQLRPIAERLAARALAQLAWAERSARVESISGRRRA